MTRRRAAPSDAEARRTRERGVHSLLRGLPPFRPFRLAAAALAGDVACPPSRPNSLIHRRLPNTPRRRDDTSRSASSDSLPQDPLGVAAQHLPRRRQLHVAGQPVEQRRPQLPLQSPDLLRRRRLRHEARLRRAGEVSVLGHRQEVPELPNVHSD